jgi:uncharacterized membrane protein YeaQ/YmgE (transglycosylase-associated protein family)
MDIVNAVVGGVPLILVVFALVEFSKSLGATGKLLTILSFALGFAFSFAYIATKAMPVDPFGWFTAVVVGVIFGATASGSYDFINARFPAK